MLPDAVGRFLGMGIALTTMGIIFGMITKLNELDDDRPLFGVGELGRDNPAEKLSECFGCRLSTPHRSKKIPPL